MDILSKEEQSAEWSKLYNRPISEEEFAEIRNNLNGFFTTLKQWSDDEERMLTENEQNNDKRSILLSSAP